MGPSVGECLRHLIRRYEASVDEGGGGGGAAAAASAAADDIRTARRAIGLRILHKMVALAVTQQNNSTVWRAWWGAVFDAFTVEVDAMDERPIGIRGDMGPLDRLVEDPDRWLGGDVND